MVITDFECGYERFEFFVHFYHFQLSADAELASRQIAHGSRSPIHHSIHHSITRRRQDGRDHGCCVHAGAAGQPCCCFRHPVDHHAVFTGCGRQRRCYRPVQVARHAPRPVAAGESICSAGRRPPGCPAAPSGWMTLNRPCVSPPTCKPT